MSSSEFANAVRNDDFKQVKIILQKSKVLLDVNQAFEHELTALHLAIVKNRADIIELLLNRGADTNLKDQNGNSCLHFAVKSGNIDLVKLILSTDIDLDGVNRSNFTALHIAIIRGKYKIAKLLLKNKANIDTQNSNGDCPLFDAVIFKRNNLAKLLLRYQANPNLSNNDGVTPLMKALEEGNDHLLELFLNNDADVSIKDWEGQNVLHYAVMFGSHESVKKLLQLKMNIDEPDARGKTPLHLLIEFSAKPESEVYKLVKLMVKVYRAEVNATDKCNQTPLYYAINCHRIKTARLLLDLGAEPNIHGKDSPLCLAVEKGFEDLIKYLIDKEAKLDVKNRRQQNLLDIAVRWISNDELQKRIILLLIGSGVAMNKNELYKMNDFRYTLVKINYRSILRLKKRKVCQDSEVTCYDLLAKRGNALVKCLRDENVRLAARSLIKTNSCRDLYKQFSDMFKDNYTQGLNRFYLLKKFQKSFYKDANGKIPFDVIVMVSEHLDNIHLRKYLKK